MKTYMYLLEVITNLHMGDGDVNFNIIDNEVERDAVTGLPTMNSSGIKGALREHFKRKNYPSVIDIFGNENKPGATSKPGEVKFYNANCLALAMRNSAGDVPFSVVSNTSVLDNLEFYMQSVMKKSYGGYTVQNNGKILEIEGYKGESIKFNNSKLKLDKQISDNLAIISYSDFKEVSLPVVARNELKNGKSNNLWYEEFVPHHSVFYTFVSSENDALLDQFNQKIDGQMIQFGANASIGQGFVKWIKVEEYHV